MKRLKRYIVFILCLSMLASVGLVGCQKNSGENETKETHETSGETKEPDVNPGTNGPLTIYPELPERIGRYYMYTVRVTQQEQTEKLPVYNHVFASGVTRNQQDTTADQNRRFSTFAFDKANGQVRVDIRVNCDFNSYSVIPSAKNFKNEFSNGVISVYLDKPDYFMIRLDNKDSTLLAVFADEPETDVPKAGSNTIIIDGWHEEENGVLELKKEGTTVYIKPGAVLNARVNVRADNCKIIGRGIMLDPFGDIYRTFESNVEQHAMIWVYNADNTVIDGIHFLNAKTFNIFVQGVWARTYANNTKVTNLKILSSEITSDGISFNYYNKNSVAEHCFVYCGDNALVYEDEAHYKDMLIGSTCNAIYPQTDIRNTSCEDIYIFRADEGIINTAMSGSQKRTIIDNCTITNLYALDVTYTPYFLFVENPTDAPAVSENGGMTIKNVYLPKLDALGKRFYQNITSGNFQVTLTNISIDGTAIASIETALNGVDGYRGYVYKDGSSSWGWIGYPQGHEFRYTTTSDFNANVKKHSVTVNYKNDTNVFVGRYPVYYEVPIIREGTTILLPLEQTQRELRTDKLPTTVERNGISYVSVDNLVNGGLAKEVAVDGNKVVITPKYNGENLLLQDGTTGVSQFDRQYGSHEVIAAKEGNTTVYRVMDSNNQATTIGLTGVINEAIKKYGVGTYRITFMVKTDATAQIETSVTYGNSVDHKSGVTTVTSGWTTCTLEFSVKNSLLVQPQIRLTIKETKNALSEFEIKDLSLVKLS